MGNATKTEKTDTEHAPGLRPTGELVWCHAADTAHVEVAHRLADRLTQDRPDL